MTNLSTQQGSASGIATIIIFVVLLIAALGFGGWAYKERTTYKTQSDRLVATAVKENTTKVQLEDAEKYAEAAKEPYLTWQGPSAFGSVEITYPKTWSVYSDGQAGTSSPVNVFAHPAVVPTIKDDNSSYALRVQVVPTAYSAVLSQLASAQKSGRVTIAVYSLPKNPEVVGSRVSGQISQKKQGTMIILPVRDKTLKIWTESAAFQPDFDNVILPNARFSP